MSSSPAHDSNYHPHSHLQHQQHPHKRQRRDPPQSYREHSSPGQQNNYHHITGLAGETPPPPPQLQNVTHPAMSGNSLRTDGDEAVARALQDRFDREAQQDSLHSAPQQQQDPLLSPTDHFLVPNSGPPGNKAASQRHMVSNSDTYGSTAVFRRKDELGPSPAPEGSRQTQHGSLYATSDQVGDSASHMRALSDLVRGDGSATPRLVQHEPHTRQLQRVATIPTTFLTDTPPPVMQADQVQQLVRLEASRACRIACPRCQEMFVELDAESVLGHARSIIMSRNDGSLGIPCLNCSARFQDDQSRLAAIWVLLCFYDTKNEHNEPGKKIQDLPAGPSRASKKDNGTGYGGRGSYIDEDDDDYFFPQPFQHAARYSQHGQGFTLGTSAADSQRKSQRPLEVGESQTIAIMTRLIEFLPSLSNPDSFDQDPPSRDLQSLFICSSILDRAADLVRTNDLGDVTAKTQLYTVTMKFLEALAMHPATAALVLGERLLRPQGTSLLDVSLKKADLAVKDNTDKAPSFDKCLTELTQSCRLMLRSKNVDAQDAQLFIRINEFNDFLVANAMTRPASQAPLAESEDKNAWMKEMAVFELADDVLLASHALAQRAPRGGNLAHGRMKRIFQEIARLQGNLPDGIFVRYGESRPDVMKILMIGPRDTPYALGLFEFDLLCGNEFPLTPPEMLFRTTGGGKVHFNPNLYAEGKVCLSLLGTWSGEPWKPNQSTLLQVLVSIHAMIFCENPWYNEPGREERKGSDAASIAYNRSRYPLTVGTAMIDWLEQREHTTSRYLIRHVNRRFGGSSSAKSSHDIWSEVVRKHFQSSARDIVNVVNKWVVESREPLPKQPRSRTPWWSSIPPAPSYFHPFPSGMPPHEISPWMKPPSTTTPPLFQGLGHTLGGAHPNIPSGAPAPPPNASTYLPYHVLEPPASHSGGPYYGAPAPPIASSHLPSHPHGPPPSHSGVDHLIPGQGYGTPYSSSAKLAGPEHSLGVSTSVSHLPASQHPKPYPEPPHATRSNCGHCHHGHGHNAVFASPGHTPGVPTAPGTPSFSAGLYDAHARNSVPPALPWAHAKESSTSGSEMVSKAMSERYKQASNSGSPAGPSLQQISQYGPDVPSLNGQANDTGKSLSYWYFEPTTAGSSQVSAQLPKGSHLASSPAESDHHPMPTSVLVRSGLSGTGRQGRTLNGSAAPASTGEAWRDELIKELREGHQNLLKNVRSPIYSMEYLEDEDFDDNDV